MKQTNNAIKFLMAQYRAVFKHAYLKGLVSAVVLTAGLAAGSAANAVTQVSGGATWNEAKDVTVNATDGSIDNTVDRVFNNLTINNPGVLTVTAGANANAVSIKGTLQVNSGSTLNVGSGNTAGAIYGWDAQEYAGSPDTVYGDLVSFGTINIGNSTPGKGQVQMDNISLESGSITNIQGPTNSKWNSVSMLVGGFEDGKIEIKKGATLNLNSNSQLTATTGTQIDINGTVNLTASTSSDIAIIRANDNFDSDTNTFSDTKVSGIVNLGQTAQVTAKESSGTIGIFAAQINIDGNTDATDPTITVASGANLQLDGDMLQKNVTLDKAGHGAAQITMNSGVINIASGGTLTVGSGSFTGSDSITTFDVKGGKLTGEGTLQVLGTLKINQDVFDAYIEQDGLVKTDSGESVLEFFGDTATDLSAYTYSGGTGAQIQIADATTLKGENLAVSGLLTQVGTTVTAAASDISIEATNLTLGDSDYTGTTTLGFSGATTRNVTFKAQNGTFTLADDLTLSAIDTITNPFDDSEHDFEYAGEGQITGDFIVSGSQPLKIEAGNYTNENSIKLVSGGLTVGNASNSKDASLVQNGEFIINAGDNNQTILVSGNGTITFDTNVTRDAYAVLDISQASNFDIERTGTGLTTFKAIGGTIIVNEDQVAEILNLKSESNSGTEVVLSGSGVLEVLGDITGQNGTTGLDVSKLTSGSTATTDQIRFSGTGTVKADSIWLASTAAATALDIGSGTLQADVIRLDQDEKDASDTTKHKDFTINNGSLVVGSSLTSSNSKGNAIVLGNGTTGVDVTLGYVEENTDEWGIGNHTYTTSSDTGTVTQDLTLSGATSDPSKLNVDYGNWTAKSITLNSGTLTVGADKAYTDINGDEFKFDASLSATALKLTTSKSTATINTNGAATFDTLTMNNGAVNVYGSMTVNGDYVAANLSTGAAASYGVAITGGAINVSGRNALLSFGSEAVQAITINGDTVTVAANTFAQNITVDDFATLKLDFGDISFSEDALKSLRKALLSNSTNGAALDAGYIDLGNANIAGIKVTDGTVDWTNLEQYKDITDIKTQEMSNATLINVDSNDIVSANVGNIQADGTTQTVQLADTVLSNADAGKGQGNFIFNANDPKTPINATIVSGAHVTLENGGSVGNLSLAQGNSETDQTILNVVSSGEAVTNITSISAATDTLVNISGTTKVENNVNAANLQVDQDLTVNKSVTLTGDLTSSADATGKITANTLSVGGATEYSGNLEIAGNASFTEETYLGGNNTFQARATFESGLELDRGVSTAKTMVLGDGTNTVDLEIVGYANLTADVIEGKGSSGVNIFVGEEAGTKGDESWESAPGFLTVGRADLNGGYLATDPEYGKTATLVAVGSFGEQGDYTAAKGNEAGTLNGDIFALRNSIVGIGVTDGDTKALEQIKTAFSRYFDGNGSLDKDNVGSIAYVAKALDVEDGYKLVIDASQSFSSFESDLNAGGTYASKINDNDIYLGSNSVLAFSDYAVLDSTSGTTTKTQRAALEFASTDASLYAEKGAKIVLVGDDFSTRDEIMLFRDQGGTGHEGILINGNNVTVETLNGLLNFVLTQGKEETGGTLSLNYNAVDSAFNQASAPVKYSLISYAANDNNWADTSADHETDQLHGAAATGIYSDDGKTFYTKTGDTKKELTEEEAKDLVAIGYTKDGNTKYNVYHDAYNYFLDDVVRNSTTGIEAEQAARLAVYGGAAQAALTAGATTYDAISGRMGVGATTGSITFADNGQGAGLWISPVYKNHDSDDFNAQGAAYGVDMDLYGVALGGDFTLANGFRVGAAFNVGSGDADGQGTGNGVSNDFDYYGFAVYGGYTLDKLSLVADLSYTVVDNDVEANTSVEKISASMDSTNLSVGVTGQYTFDFNGMNIVPHAGLRYTNIDLDDYTVKGSGDIAHFDGDSVNVFSIPVGVTLSKDIAMGDWTIKPAFDLTLTANMGDDSIEGNVKWAGIENMQTQVESEVLDSFTYGATLGVAAKTGNLSLGFGINYTGASSADEFGVGANARFVF